MFLDDIVGPLTIEEAKSRRMSAQMKLARAFDREQQKSAASRERAKELLNPTKPEQTKPTQNEIKQRLDAKCWTGKHKEGTKIKGGVRVNNCVPNEAANPAQQAAIAIAKKKEQGVEEGHADQQRKIFKKNGKPVGEVGIDRESSPGVGQWYMTCYGVVSYGGYDSYEEAVAELKHCLKQGVAEGFQPVVPVKSRSQGSVSPERQKDIDRDVKLLNKYREKGMSAGSAADRLAKFKHKHMEEQGVAEGDHEFRNQERNAGLEPEDNGTYSIWTQGAKDAKPKSIITKQCSMDDAERHARSIKKKYPFLKVWMQAHHLGKGGFFPMNEDSWSDGQGQWSSEHDQWAKESVEYTDSSEAVYSAIIRRIIGAHSGLLGQYGPERVMAAVQDVADWNSDAEEIGSSDVSGWVRQVFQKLQNNEY